MVNDSLFSADRYCDVLFSWQAPAQNSPWETPQAVCVLSSLCGKRQATPAQQMLLLTRGPSSRGWWRPAWLGLGRCWTEKPVTSTTAPLQSLSLSLQAEKSLCRVQVSTVKYNCVQNFMIKYSDIVFIFKYADARAICSPNNNKTEQSLYRPFSHWIYWNE